MRRSTDVQTCPLAPLLGFAAWLSAALAVLGLLAGATLTVMGEPFGPVAIGAAINCAIGALVFGALGGVLIRVARIEAAVCRDESTAGWSAANVTGRTGMFRVRHRGERGNAEELIPADSAGDARAKAMVRGLVVLSIDPA